MNNIDVLSNRSLFYMWYNYLNILPDWHQVRTLRGDNIPLNDAQRRVIDVNQCQLVKVINSVKGIIDQLHANKCFNSLHKDHIECGVNISDKSERLLDIMRRRSFADFSKLVEALNTGGYPGLAQILREGGGKLVILQKCNYLFSLRSRWLLCFSTLITIVISLSEIHDRDWSNAHHVTWINNELSLIHIWRCRRSTLCRSRWSPYH